MCRRLNASAGKLQVLKTRSGHSQYEETKMFAGRRLVIFIAVIILLLAFSSIATISADTAQSGTILSAVIVSNDSPEVGDLIKVDILLDATNVEPPDNNLGSFSGNLTWDPSILAYNSDSGVDPALFTGFVNPLGDHLIFNGANATGVQGSNVVLTITFEVIGTGTCDLDMGYSAMSAAYTFANLLPILTVQDGQVQVGESGFEAFLPLIQGE